MGDTKYIDVQDFSIGYDVTHKTTMTRIIACFDRFVSPEGNLVEPVSAINDKTPSAVAHRHRYIELNLITDGWNYEALFTQQVESGDADSRAIRQGADNDPIGYLVATLTKTSGTDTVTYEGGRNVLSRFHLSVSNRKGRKYQPVTMVFKVRGNRTES